MRVVVGDEHDTCTSSYLLSLFADDESSVFIDIDAAHSGNEARIPDLIFYSIFLSFIIFIGTRATRRGSPTFILIHWAMRLIFLLRCDDLNPSSTPAVTGRRASSTTSTAPASNLT